ncbi:MAG: hypothetical protein RMN51_05645 [Verrucomicrobiota bacterium]|nr:hypothetical protein [Limisphaera sp.]MDW8381574.1 hypothetical protein [Verrucomicrobiota bacterium]
MKTVYILTCFWACIPTALLCAQQDKPLPPRYGVTALIQETDKPFGREIILEGFLTAVCKRGGKKAWLHDTNPDAAGTVRVERTGNMPAFSQDLIGKTIRVRGTLREQRLDAAFFDAWEARLKAKLQARGTAVHPKEEACTETCRENAPAESQLKAIAAYRKKLAQSPTGYLTAFWVDGIQWELVEATRQPEHEVSK